MPDLIDVNATLPVTPAPKARPQATLIPAGDKPGAVCRFCKAPIKCVQCGRGYRVLLFTPDTTRDYERKIAEWARDALPSAPIDGPLLLEVWAFFPRPERLMGRKHPNGPVLHDKRPDLDNIDKAIQDAIKRHLRDDAQFCDLELHKRYTERNGLPRVCLRILQVTEETAAAVPDWALTTDSAPAPAADPNALTPDLFGGR